MKKSKSRKKRKPAAKRRVKIRKKKGIPFQAKDFLSLKETQAVDYETLFKLAEKMKRRPEDFLGKLKGKSIDL